MPLKDKMIFLSIQQSFLYFFLRAVHIDLKSIIGEGRQLLSLTELKSPLISSQFPVEIPEISFQKSVS